MTEPLVTKTQAIALKELELYGESLNSAYVVSENNGLLYIPTISLALRFMREKYDFHIEISYDYYLYNVYIHGNLGDIEVRLISTLGDGTPYCFTEYDAAASAGLDKLIEIAKQNANSN